MIRAKRNIAYLLSMTLVLTSLPTRIFSQAEVTIPNSSTLLNAVESTTSSSLKFETTTSGALEIIPNKYVGDGYEVEFKVANRWPGGFNGEFIVTNTGKEAIENWALELDFNHDITQIWNASIKNHDGNTYVLKNLGYNQDIKVGESINIGFQAEWEDIINAPSKYDLLGTKEEASDEKYAIDFKVTSDWGSAFNGEISITNNGEEVIEDWTLEFDFDKNIERFWTAEILEHEDEHYVIKNAGYNANIQPGQTLRLGLGGNPGDVESEPENYVLNQVVEKVDYEKDSDEDGLPDLFEKDLGTDSNNKDSDGDGLPDGYEYFELQTEPLDIDTDGNGILDNDEDFDSDNLNNLEEYNLETDPYSEDTDGDYLLDGDEVRKFQTNPIIYDKIDIKLDSDSDGLFDGVEMILGTDPFNQDTDGDGLIDSYEHLMVGTDPLLNDTDNNNINDAYEDFDKDGLNNLEEYLLKTNPLIDDSDDDDLLDGLEVNSYDTNPLLEDTDEDGLTDGDEILLGFNPLIKDSDYNGVKDSEEKVNQTCIQKIEDQQNNQILSVSVNLDCAGNIKNNVKIHNMYNIDILSSEVSGLIGVPVAITSNSEFKEAIITFKYDDTMLDNTKEEDLAIMWYDEDNDVYEIFDQDTIIDSNNNTVSYTATHFSTYLLVDRQQWYNAWKNNIDYSRPEETKTFFDIGIVVDTSGSMSGSKIVTVRNGLNSFIDAMYEGDDASIVRFSSYAYLVNQFGSTREELKSGIDSLYASGGTNTDSGLKLGISNIIDKSSSNEKIIILICDGDVNYTQSTIDQAKKNNIKIYTVNIGYSPAHLSLQKIAHETGGKYYFATTVAELLDILMQIQCQTIQGIDTQDTDGDGLYDIFETKGMRISNGNIVTSDPLLKDTDGDGLLDSEEVSYLGTINTEYEFQRAYTKSNKKNDYKSSFSYLSNANSLDTDGDGILDYKEIVSERNKYNETYIKNNTKFTRYLATNKDVHTFKYEPEYNIVNKVYTQGSTDTLLKIYFIRRYGKNEPYLIAEDNDSGADKNAEISHSFFPQKDIFFQVKGGYKFEVSGGSNSAGGEYDIILQQSGVYEDAGFKDGDYTIIYAVNPKGAFPFLVQLRENKYGQLTHSFVNDGDAEKYAHLTSTYVTGPEFMSIAVGFTPVDMYKDFGDFCAGKDTLTGDEINRWVLAACIITPEIIDIGIKQCGKNADEISEFIKVGKYVNIPTEIQQLLNKMPELTGTNREKLLSITQNKELHKLVNELYRPTATVGDGGTASILIYEFYSGETSKHLKKARERLGNLNSIIKNNKLSLNDSYIAEALRTDLENALKLFE